jgi:RNA polymerase sigma factor for flagellar operon FliA
MAIQPQLLPEYWRKYKTENDLDARLQLIDHYKYLVKITAGRVVSSPPPGLDREDLVGAGVQGLIKAIDQFDRSREVKFETYAIALIRGAILEMLRDEDWVPRSIRERLKLLERTHMHLEAKLGRPPREVEVAEAMNMTLEDYHQLLIQLGRTTLASIDDVLASNEAEDQLRVSDIVEDRHSNPEGEIHGKEIRRLLTDCIERLPEREHLVITLYYYEGLTFKEIGKVLGVSESRVYQLHTQAMLRLRVGLSDNVTMFAHQ